MNSLPSDHPDEEQVSLLLTQSDWKARTQSYTVLPQNPKEQPEFEIRFED